MDPNLKSILDERLTRGEIDLEEHARLLSRLDEPGDGDQYAVVLTECGPNKISVIRVVRETTGLGLKESKLLVEAAPALVVEGVDREAAQAVVLNLQEAGARAELARAGAGSLAVARQAAVAARAQASSGCLLTALAALAAVALAWL